MPVRVPATESERLYFGGENTEFRGRKELWFKFPFLLMEGRMAKSKMVLY